MSMQFTEKKHLTEEQILKDIEYSKKVKEVFKDFIDKDLVYSTEKGFYFKEKTDEK